MSTVTCKTLDGATTTLAADVLDSLRSSLRGALCFPGDPGYEQARTLWNAMIDRRPAAVVRAAGAADVRQTVRLAKENRLLLSVRGGGHHIAGDAVSDGCWMLDLSPMKSVRVDPVGRTARVEPGVTLGEFDREAQAFGLATPLGINSTTGVAGLALGGGFGWLSRKYGLTVDNLLSVDMVLANGEWVRASETEKPDLFWAVRGGGGNFGVVTSFEFRLHPVGPKVLSGLIVHPFANAKAVLEGYRRVAATAPDELTCWVVMRKAPPLPFLAKEVHGTEVVVLALCYAGDVEQGRQAVAPLQALGKPLADVVGLNPLADWQTTFDPLLTPGFRNYWKSHDFRELPDAALQVMLKHVGRLPNAACEVFLAHMGGAVSRLPTGATAFPHRDVQFVMNAHTRWSEPSQDKVCISWARDLFEEVAPYSTGGVYVNFMPGDEGQRVARGGYGANFDRLAKLKAQYDPQNLFRLNQNIRPVT